MSPEEFVRAFTQEKASQMLDYFSDDPQTATGQLIKSLGLDSSQISALKNAFDTCLTDTYYTVLLGLDGSCGIGEMQHTFKIYDEENHLLSDCGDLEAEAYTQFHEPNADG